MSIQINQLSKVFGTQKAVDDISFQAEAGQILGFLGPNGAGKSTTMKILACYLEPSAGTATVCGFDTTKEPLEVRKRLGYLAEHNPLYKDMYVKEYLSFVADLHLLENKKKRVEEMIERTGLGREMHKQIGTLSKGYRQRVGLAQAMIHDPEVLILDEPTNGLDPNQLLEIRSLIQDLGKDKTVLFSSHIMQEVQAICDRVVIIDKGELVANESMDNLTAQLVGNQIIHVECAEAFDHSKIKSLKGVEEVIVESSSKIKLIAKGDTDLRPLLFKQIVAMDATLLELRKEQQSVESVFQQLTQN